MKKNKGRRSRSKSKGSGGKGDNVGREERIINKAAKRLQKMMAQGQYLDQRQHGSARDQRNRGSRSPSRSRGRSERRRSPSVTMRGKDTCMIGLSPSEATIYQDAIKPARPSSGVIQSFSCNKSNNRQLPQANRKSSSSEADTSDEIIEVSDLMGNFNFKSPSHTVVDHGRDRDRGGRARSHHESGAHGYRREGAAAERYPDQLRASTSGYNQMRRASAGPGPQPGGQVDELEVAERRAEQLIHEAEGAKARILEVPGMPTDNIFNVNNELIHSSMVDQNFLMVAAHVDDRLKHQIACGKYVDFSRLLPKDRGTDEEMQEMRMVNKNGQAFYIPASELTNAGQNAITSFNKWEQAFRVFTDIFCREHPTRASELIQYNHIIHMASLTYAWDNVYKYDRLFRSHITQHPTRSWSIILQQAWSITLKDKHGTNSSTGGGDSRGRGRQHDLCFRYNRGKCSYGTKCKFEHHCAVCNKFGHGAFSCRKLQDFGEGMDRKQDKRRRDGGGKSSAPNVKN